MSSGIFQTSWEPLSEVWVKRSVRLKQTKPVGMVLVVKEAAFAVLSCLQVASSELGKKATVMLPYPCLLRVEKECQHYNVRFERKKQYQVRGSYFCAYTPSSQKDRSKKCLSIIMLCS